MHPMCITHHHLGDLSIFDWPWPSSSDILNRSFVMSDYFAATDGLPIAKTVYMEVDVTPEQQQAEADYVIDLCGRDDNPMAGAVVSGRVASEGFRPYITALKRSAYIKGVRQVLHTQPAGTCTEAAFVKGVQLLGELDLSFDICIRSPELADAVTLVDACPETRFVLDHCGNAKVPAFSPKQSDAKLRDEAAQWKRDIDALTAREHVICKISGIVAGAPKGWTSDDLAPIINHCLDAFGPERVVFGGDWPVCTLAATYRQWVDALREIISDRPDAQQRKLFHDNAAAFYDV